MSNLILFTNWEKLSEYAKKHSDDFYLLEDSNQTRQLITKYELSALMISEDKSSSDVGVYKFVYRYVPMAQLLDRICVVMNSEKSCEEKEEFVVHSIVCPVHRFDVDNIMHIASKMLDKKTIIFDFRINETWTGENMPRLSDVLYSIHEKSQKTMNIIHNSQEDRNNVMIISGLVSEQDISLITVEDIDYLIRAIMEDANFDRVILLLENQLLEVVSQSIVATGTVVVIRGSKKEKDIIEWYENKGCTFLEKYVLDCESKYLDMSTDEIDDDETGVSQIREVVRKWGDEGIFRLSGDDERS